MICGIDEAGRGCVAGSLFVCAIKCDESELAKIQSVRDSKTLTRAQREKIYCQAKHINHIVVSFSAQEIDKMGLSACMKQALKSCVSAMGEAQYIFDGNTNFGVESVQCLIKGDSLIPQISLASIIAKVYKDRESDELHKQYPQYELHKHKGYATKKHIEHIKKYGYSPIHRKSFYIKSLERDLF